MRNVCVEIPKEDLTEADKRHDKVGHLKMSLYGPRDAAMNWQEEVAKEMTRIGFVRGRYNPCLYFQPKKEPENVPTWRRLRNRWHPGRGAMAQRCT